MTSLLILVSFEMAHIFFRLPSTLDALLALITCSSNQLKSTLSEYFIILCIIMYYIIFFSIILLIFCFCRRSCSEVEVAHNLSARVLLAGHSCLRTLLSIPAVSSPPREAPALPSPLRSTLPLSSEVDAQNRALVDLLCGPLPSNICDMVVSEHVLASVINQLQLARLAVTSPIICTSVASSITASFRVLSSLLRSKPMHFREVLFSLFVPASCISRERSYKFQIVDSSLDPCECDEKGDSYKFPCNGGVWAPPQLSRNINSSIAFIRHVFNSTQSLAAATQVFFFLLVLSFILRMFSFHELIFKIFLLFLLFYMLF